MGSLVIGGKRKQGVWRGNFRWQCLPSGCFCRRPLARSRIACSWFFSTPGNLLQMTGSISLFPPGAPLSTVHYMNIKLISSNLQFKSSFSHCSKHKKVPNSARKDVFVPVSSAARSQHGVPCNGESNPVLRGP